jgi:uncharacterized membrane protein YccC
MATSKSQPQSRFVRGRPKSASCGLRPYTAGVVAPSAAPPAKLPDPWSARLTAAAGSLRPSWSRPAALRALRAIIVIPGLFALGTEVLGNAQLATYAAFGGFATLIFAGFGGTRRDKLVAHGVLAVVGSALVVIGTAVNSNTALAAAVTVPVVFCVLFAGIVGPQVASGGTAALLPYVLSAASRGTVSMVPDRLAGWWLASIVGTLAVLVLSPRPGVDRLRKAAAAVSALLADDLDAGLAGTIGPEHLEAALSEKHELLTAFAGSPYRATGFAVSDQALANLVEALQWSVGLVHDTVAEGAHVDSGAEVDRRLLQEAARVLRDASRVLEGDEVPPLLDNLDALRAESAVRFCAASSTGSIGEDDLHMSFHARVVAGAVRAVAADALIASRRVGPAVIASERRRWQGSPQPAVASASFPVFLDVIRRLLSGNTNLRSVWFLNSARGALALAAAVAVADLSNVQHGFWVVLGTLSVLRTNAAATGATAVRAIVGTAAGFFIGAGLILAIGSHNDALWAALPIAVLVAAYTPGTAPFAVGQAAFTVTISILYNIIVPIGWKVGVLRVEDVAIGAAVSAVAGLLFWPRGAMALVGDDLADAFHRDGIYLVQATAWALRIRSTPPDAGVPAFQAGNRLDDALRVLLAEQGTKDVPKDQLWRLVGGTIRLRLAAQSLATLAEPPAQGDPGSANLLAEAVRLAGVCDELAAGLGRTPASVVRELSGLPVDDAVPAGGYRGYSLWVRQHLSHVQLDLADLVTPACVVARRAALPWWR